VAAAARQEGWALVSDPDPVVILTRTMDDGTKLTLSVGRGQQGVGDVLFNKCTISAPAQDAAGISSSISDWAGVPPIPQATGSAVYVFGDGARGHQLISDPQLTNSPR
jgi:hypothetical protein